MLLFSNTFGALLIVMRLFPDHLSVLIAAQSAKSSGSNHGIGLSSIRYSCEKYGGKMQIETGDKLFTLRVMIPLTNPV